MRQILIIRFGALGDLCLLAWSISRMARSSGEGSQRITLVTKPAFVPLMEKMQGIDRVIPLPEGGLAGLSSLARKLRAEKFDIIIDAHNILRGNLLLMLMGKKPAARLAKDTVARLALLGFNKSHQSLNQTMSDRFDALFMDFSSEGLPHSIAPLVHLRPSTANSQITIGLAPGAQWDSKRWPEESYADLLAQYSRDNQNPVRLFLGPREELWFAGSSLESAAAKLPQVEIIRGKSLTEVTALLAQCSVVITNDSGLLHMAEAVGTAVLAFYGPTVRQFGYFPRLQDSRVLEVDMDCRPCSRNGKKACHRGDLACLHGIPVDRALRNLMEMISSLECSS